MRCALALACLLVVSSAQAETNQERVRRWFSKPAPAAAEVQPAAKPAEAKKTTAQQPARAPARPARLNPAPAAPVEQAQAKPKKKRAMTRTVDVNDPDYISCADARRGVRMSCFELRAGAGVYNSYSPKKKANANACLTQAERDRIASCF